jgi:hypothetical protein
MPYAGVVEVTNLPKLRRRRSWQRPVEIVSIANENLGERVESRATRGDAIIAALDEVLTRAFG